MRKHRPDWLILGMTAGLMLLGLVIIFAVGPMRVNFMKTAYGSELSENYFFVHQLISVSLAVAALFANERDLMRDFSTFGLIFESLCTRDLKVYAQHLGGDLMYYRDGAGLECDNIFHLRDGRWAAIEVKLGSADRIEEGAENLKELERKIDVEKVGAPVFKMVLTGTEHAYRREDGIFVVPIGCLRD